MARWVRVCGLAETPRPGEAMEADADGVAVCLANVSGELAAVNNICPHRHGPLGQGWVEGRAIVCPWHAWTFDLKTGQAEPPVHDRISVFAVCVDGDDVLVQMG